MRSHRDTSAWRVAAQAWETEERKWATKRSAAVLGRKASFATPAPVDDAAHPAGLFTNKPSIAVLPFINMSDDSEQDYFAEGISEDIEIELAKASLQELRRAQPNISLAWIAQHLPLRQDQREHFLEGMRCAGLN